MNQKESCAIVKELVTACHPLMDRFTLWADADISFLNLQKLTNIDSRDKIKPTITYQRMEFNSSYKYKAEFFQLTIPQLQYLQKTLSKASVNYFINYIEVSYEFITQSIKDAGVVGNIINHSLIRIRRTKTKDKDKDKILCTRQFLKFKFSERFFWHLSIHNESSLVDIEIISKA